MANENDKYVPGPVNGPMTTLEPRQALLVVLLFPVLLFILLHETLNS